MYGVKWVYFDLDGTIVPSSHKISNRTIMALMYLQSKGIKIGIATGRSYFFTESIAKNLNVDLPIICVNGAWVVKKDPFITVKDELLEWETSNEILKTLNSQNIDYMVYTQEGVYTTNKDFPFFLKLNEMKEFDKCNIPHDFKEVANRKIFNNMRILKFLVHYDNKIQRDRLTRLFKDFDDVSLASSQKHVLDIFSKQADKAIAIKWLMNKYNIKNHELLVFGDNENDINMFGLTNKSVALKNASDKVKKYAKRSTDYTCEEEGVADFIFRNF